MDESEFNQRVDDILEQIEDAIEATGADIDYETAGGILTLSFEDDSKIIINRQTPVRNRYQRLFLQSHLRFVPECHRHAG